MNILHRGSDKEEEASLPPQLEVNLILVILIL